MPRTLVFLGVLSVSTFISNAAIILAIIGGITGVVSIYMLNDKLDSLNDVTKNLDKAVKKLDARVTRIDDVVKSKKEG